MKVNLHSIALALGAAMIVLCGYIATAPTPDSARREGNPIDPALHMPPHVAAFVMRACADCHTNFTKWPWYAKIPPMSGMMMHDVRQAREAMNFSEWSSQVDSKAQAQGLLAAGCAVLKAGGMPLPRYLWLHPRARPTPAEVQTFCEWTRSPEAVVNSDDSAARR